MKAHKEQLHIFLYYIYKIFDNSKNKLLNLEVI